MFHNYFSCFVLFFCLEKWFLVFVLTLLFFLFLSSFQHSVSHLLLSCFDVSEKCCFFPTNWRSHLLLFLFLPFFFFFFFFFFCSLVFCLFFFLNKCVWLILIFLNSFWNSLFILFLSSHFSHEKNQPRNLHFLFLFSLFFVSLFFFQHFSSFLSSLFSLFIFPFILLFIPFCFSTLFLFSPFSILPLFLYLRDSNSCFFSLFWSWCLCFLASSQMCFFISVSVFLLQKKAKNKFFCGQFFEDEIMSLFFDPSRFLC